MEYLSTVIVEEQNLAKVEEEGAAANTEVLPPCADPEALVTRSTDGEIATEQELAANEELRDAGEPEIKPS